jgi:hypothetical protein
MKNKMKELSVLSLILGVVVLGCNAAAPPDTQESSSRHANNLPSPAGDLQKPRTLRGQQTTFGPETPMARPIPLPKNVIKILMRDERVIRLLQWRDAKEFRQAFAASQIDLNGDNLKDIVVQGVSPRLLGANVDPFWVFRNTGKNYKLALSTSALGLEILEGKTKSYRDIRASQATAKELFTTTFKYDGTAYVAHSTSRAPLGK